MSGKCVWVISTDDLELIQLYLRVVTIYYIRKVTLPFVVCEQ
jgi:hypothetical protein